MLIFIKREEGREREKHQPGIKPITSLCALTRDRTGNLFVYGMMLQPSEPLGRGSWGILDVPCAGPTEVPAWRAPLSVPQGDCFICVLENPIRGAAWESNLSSDLSLLLS